MRMRDGVCGGNGHQLHANGLAHLPVEAVLVAVDRAHRGRCIGWYPVASQTVRGRPHRPRDLHHRAARRVQRAAPFVALRIVVELPDHRELPSAGTMGGVGGVEGEFLVVRLQIADLPHQSHCAHRGIRRDGRQMERIGLIGQQRAHVFDGVLAHRQCHLHLHQSFTPDLCHGGVHFEAVERGTGDAKHGNAGERKPSIQARAYVDGPLVVHRRAQSTRPPPTRQDAGRTHVRSKPLYGCSEFVRCRG
jgi:hypothetical protein